jgi:hypothetical protein
LALGRNRRGILRQKKFPRLIEDADPTPEYRKIGLYILDPYEKFGSLHRAIDEGRRHSQPMPHLAKKMNRAIDNLEKKRFLFCFWLYGYGCVFVQPDQRFISKNQSGTTFFQYPYDISAAEQIIPMYIFPCHRPGALHLNISLHRNRFGHPLLTLCGQAIMAH